MKNMVYRYVELLNEYTLNNNYSFSKEDLALINEVNNTTDSNIQNLIFRVKQEKDLNERINILNNFYRPVENNIPLVENRQINNNPISEVEKPKTKIRLFGKKNRKAGYIDALVLALVTGFFGGIFTTIMLIAVNK